MKLDFTHVYEFLIELDCRWLVMKKKKKINTLEKSSVTVISHLIIDYDTTTVGKVG